MKRLALAALLTCLWASPGVADDKFSIMDTDTNNAISWEEFQAQHPNMKKAAFDTIDKNADGAISHEEWDAFMGSHGASGAGMGAGMGKGMGGGMGMPPKGKMGMPPKEGMTTMPPSQAAPEQGKILIEPPKKSE